MAAGGHAREDLIFKTAANELRISCKRLARPTLSYVPPPAIGGWRSMEPNSEALVGCMRWLGDAYVSSAATACRT